MQKGIPTQELHCFVPRYSNESDWEKLVNFSTPDDAYLIVATPDGRAVWLAHGSYSDGQWTLLSPCGTAHSLQIWK